MPVYLFVTLMSIGLGIGFLAGLIGLGGGIIMTPVQYSIYTSAGWTSDMATKVAFATSLAIIFPTAVSGVWRHHRENVIHWKAAISMGIVTFACSVFGAWFASSQLSGSILRIVFAAIVLLAGVRMLMLKVSEVQQPVRDNIWLWLGLAVPIGIITGLLGIGGGVIVIPLLVLVLRFRMHSAVATSLAIMLFSSAGGILGWTVIGAQAANLPAHTLGYIYWPAWLALSVTSICLAQVGAMVGHKLHSWQLKYIFVVVVFSIGLYMVGVFNWIIDKL